MKRNNAIFCMLLGVVMGIFLGLMAAESVLTQQRQTIETYASRVAVEQFYASIRIDELVTLKADYYKRYAILLIKVDHFTDAIEAWNELHPEQQYFMNIDDEILSKDLGL